MLMLEYEAQKDLFNFLNLEKIPKMHWTNNFNRVMAQHMHGIILEATQFAIGATQYLSLICDEVSTIDNQSWLSIHAYVVQNWLRILINYFVLGICHYEKLCLLKPHYHAIKTQKTIRI
jgi:hypothetical protein